MTEILWHGRGGQGAFTAARLLGDAYSLKDNAYALAFPSFGPERRGAPIRAFTKLDQKPIGNRSEITKSNYSMFLDDTLFNAKSFRELKQNGKILLNTKK
ncbi:MAG: 2-oxoacid:acceptor oxidoreductase family protein, partial [Ruminococcus sp.]|nr:2-oxoacid:acceptor oxidoreductase family protein [Ruminococcus sp.]